MVQGTGSTDYDLGLYYIGEIMNEVLKAYYYSKQNISKLTLEEAYEIKRENFEVYFTDRVFKAYIDINLSKLIENDKKAWSLYQLLKVIHKYNWPDEDGIKNAIESFTIVIRDIRTSRHERIAHLSKKNRPNVVHINYELTDYRNIIEKAVMLVDRFVDGKIPYLLYCSESEDIDLRAIVSQR